MHSHHSHSGAYCRHANPSTSPKSMLALAKRRGFTHYHLTEHIPRSEESQLYPEEREANVSVSDLRSTFDAYIHEARALQERYRTDDSMHVLVGAETENVDARSTEGLSFVEQVLRQPSSGDERSDAWRVDFLVGSVHHVYGIPVDFDRPTFERCLQFVFDRDGPTKQVESLISLDERQTAAHLLLIDAYLDAQNALIERLQPEVIGHFDLCRLFDCSAPMTFSQKAATTDSLSAPLQALLSKVDEKVRRNVRKAVEYGALFEVNSASVRKGWPTPYPGSDVFDVILEANGRFCLSDDAHAHEQVGLNYHKSFEYLSAKGVEHVWVLERDGRKAAAEGQEDKEVPRAFPRGTRATPIPLSKLIPFIGNNS